VLLELKSEFNLFKEENARLMAKITRLEFEKVKLKAKNAKLKKRVTKLKEK